MYASDFRAQGRASLRGNWGKAILASLIAALLGGLLSGAADGPVVRLVFNNVSTYLPDYLKELLRSERWQLYRQPVVSFLNFYSLAALIIGGPIALGFARFNLNLADRRNAEVAQVFSGFERFLDGFLMGLLLFVYVFLWSLLFVIPGIVKAYSYSMTPFILAEHPGMRPNEAITASRHLMKGNKWRLFCLNFSFIGWAILSALTFGIGSLFLRPYIEASTACFYRRICQERQQRGVFTSGSRA